MIKCVEILVKSGSNPDPDGRQSKMKKYITIVPTCTSLCLILKNHFEPMRCMLSVFSHLNDDAGHLQLFLR